MYITCIHLYAIICLRARCLNIRNVTTWKQNVIRTVLLVEPKSSGFFCLPRASRRLFRSETGRMIEIVRLGNSRIRYIRGYTPRAECGLPILGGKNPDEIP